jgi:NAD(P)H dehydrogenase (quinone)
MPRLLVLYDSHAGRTGALARAVAQGATEAGAAEVTLARIPPLDDAATFYGPGAVDDAPLAGPEALEQAEGLAVGTPVHLGAPSAATMRFFAGTGRLWLGRALAGRPATVFAAAGSGGGGEAALLTLWSVLANHGMLLVPGVPEAAEGPGGGPFGALAPMAAGEEAEARARAQGASLARVAGRLAAPRC